MALEKKLYLIFTFALCLIFFPIQSSEASNLSASFCEDKLLSKMPVLSKGRMVPFFVHAKKSRKYLFARNICKQVPSSTLYCYLSLGLRKELEKKWQCKLALETKHKLLKSLLGLNSEENFINLDSAFQKREILLKEYNKRVGGGKKTDMGSVDALSAVLNRLGLLREIAEGEDWKYLDSERNWKNVNSIKGSGEEFKKVIINSTFYITSKEKRNLKLETLYEKANPFIYAIIFSLLGFIFTLLSLKFSKKGFFWISNSLLTSVVLVELYGMVLRTFISGRAPIANMYETVMLTGLGALIFSIFLAIKSKDRKILLFGLVANLICLFMMRFAPTVLDGDIKPLVPVLRNNFWLSTHVTTITLAYALFTLAWVVGNYVIVKELLFPHKTGEEKIVFWNNMIRPTLQVAVIFLALGIILGGVWADYSWGRFWGWDPKETWSLISLIVYLIILHGKYIGWFKGIRFTVVSIGGYLFILMTWFGVNYILSSGLHSYGSDSKNGEFLYVVFAIQIVLLAMSFLKHKFGGRWSGALRSFVLSICMISFLSISFVSHAVSEKAKSRKGMSFLKRMTPVYPSEGIITEKSSNKKKCMVHFWASWCSSCFEEMKDILKFLENHNDKIDEFYFISLDKDPKKHLKFWQRVLKQNEINIKYSNVYILLGDKKYLKKFGVSQVPETYIFNQGLQIRRMIGPQKWENNGSLINFLEAI